MAKIPRLVPTVLLAVGFAILFAIRWALSWIAAFHPAFFLGGSAVVIVATTAGVSLARRRRRRRMVREVQAAGWDPIDAQGRQWPWDGQLRQGAVTVETVWTREVAGFPVIVGRVRWTGNAFAGLVREREAHGLVVVVRLPQPEPAMALRSMYRFVGDSPRLDRPELRWAALRDELPTWTVVGDELFTVETHQDWITPEATDRSVHRALHVLNLLGIASHLPADGTSVGVDSRSSLDRAPLAFDSRSSADGTCLEAAAPAVAGPDTSDLEGAGLDVTRLRGLGLDSARLRALGFDVPDSETSNP
ncbi:hypothetical protein BJY16_008309 [Actinoplanes octamycinicus]|uniref:Uncharacterized protein n=1 Tax=Actinoplanes octamycinicus TaxID=135948 RepID=A0A7W7H6D9_9ACTN|nr:hypothetical protein [Actinoplanes octamycinicus]MBB4744850.1 hypothetical protein [Actinoplanes octamycinicus]GIE55436.1 hypothetical protein Aoc01nite_08380 [Actinoplanes octamycinicus]